GNGSHADEEEKEGTDCLRDDGIPRTAHGSQANLDIVRQRLPSACILRMPERHHRGEMTTLRPISAEYRFIRRPRVRPHDRQIRLSDGRRLGYAEYGDPH